MFGYKVDIEQYCEHNERSDEDYGSWSSSFTNSLSDIVRKTNEYPDIVSSLDIAPGTRALVVWVDPKVLIEGPFGSYNAQVFLAEMKRQAEVSHD